MTLLYTYSMSYREQGKVSEAIQLLNNSLAIKEKVFGHDHPSVSDGHHNGTFYMLALCYGGIGFLMFFCVALY